MGQDPLKVELLFTKDRDAWRLYVHGWIAPYVRAKLSKQADAFPVRQPDLDELEQFMWATDAPYMKQVSTLGHVEIEAKGRSAVALNEWLDEYLAS